MSDNSAAEKWLYERNYELTDHTEIMMVKAMTDFALAHNSELVKALKDAEPVLQHELHCRCTRLSVFRQEDGNGRTADNKLVRCNCKLFNLLQRIHSLTEGKQP